MKLNNNNILKKNGLRNKMIYKYSEKNRQRVCIINDFRQPMNIIDDHFLMVIRQTQSSNNITENIKGTRISSGLKIRFLNNILVKLVLIGQEKTLYQISKANVEIPPLKVGWHGL